MATKPLATTLPRWASTVTANPARYVEPPSGKKDIGWDVAEKPPAQWKNWLLYNTYNWLVWLDAFESEAHTWSATQTFGVGISVSNSTLNTRAIYGIGNGSAEGIKGVGGASGHGVIGEATGLGTYGVFGRGLAAGVIGIRGEGGSGSAGGTFLGGSGAAGVLAAGGTGNSDGVAGTGSGLGAGVYGQGGATGNGITGIGGATSGYGGDFTGGAGSSDGVRATGGATNGNGVLALGTGSGEGIQATGGSTGHGGTFFGGATSGDGVQSIGGPGGYGILATGGSNKAGARAVGGAGNAPGLEAVPSGNGAGIEVAGGGTGIAISATANIVTSTDVIVGTGALCSISGSKVEFSTVTHPAGNATIKHQVRPINTARAYLSIVTDGAGGHTIEDSAGIASVTLTATTFDITFTDAFATAKYVAIPTGDGATYKVTAANKTAAVCKVSSTLSPLGNILAMDVVFFGRQ